MEFIRIGLLAVVGISLGIQLKGQKQEYGLYVGLALCLLTGALRAADLLLWTDPATGFAC